MRKHVSFIVRIVSAITVGGWFAAVDRQAAVADQAARPIDEFVRSYCIDCHQGEDPSGGLGLDVLPTDFGHAVHASRWAEVLGVIDGHDMPPADAPQPTVSEATEFARRLEAELARGELSRRSTQTVLRRMNRDEYRRTIRDLVGVDFDPAVDFPADPSAGGFDNIAQALSMSPLQMELYYDAARKLLDRALFCGPQPATVNWRFEPEQNVTGTDRFRVRRGDNNILVNDGENITEDGFTVIHHDAWNKGVGFRDFRLPVAGDYAIRIRAAGRVPGRDAVVRSAETLLRDRYQNEKPRGSMSDAELEKHIDRELDHFRTDRMYQYGPPRLRLAIDLGGTPTVIDERDIEAATTDPVTYEVRTYFTTATAGVRLNYAYSVPSVLENFWMQNRDEFARPELLIDWIEVEGPIHATWPPPSHRRLLGDTPENPTDEIAAARNVLSRFMRRSFRRPLLPGELEAKLALFESVRSDQPSFIEAIKVPLAAVLTSPHFLYLNAPRSSVDPGSPPTVDPPKSSPRRIDDFELATRLSYFLWSTMPDEELFGLASANELSRDDVLTRQITRMLADPKSEALVANFAGQWLGLRQIGANPPAQSLYPEYDRHLEVSMQRETEAFFAEVLRNDLDFRNLIQSDFVTINQRLARFYGIDGVQGDDIRTVPAPPSSHRGGLITQASIHCITSNGTRTSPVTRGAWVLKTLLGTDPGLPVANVGEIPTAVPGIDKATVRERLAIHRGNPACARCHDKIDPLGLALENFNACGQWRDREGHGYQGRIGPDDPLIDASSTMPDGTVFVGVEGLQQELLKNQDLFATALASRLTTYALGRELGFSDREAVRRHVAAMNRGGATLRSLIQSIVRSDAFQSE